MKGIIRFLSASPLVVPVALCMAGYPYGPEEKVPEEFNAGFSLYPNRDHGLREGRGTADHLRMLMTRYLLEHLPPGPR